jgi:hypothetical protein
VQLSPFPLPPCHSNHLTSHFHPPPPHGSRYTRTSLPALSTPCFLHQPHSFAPHLPALSALPSSLSFRLLHSHLCPCHALPTSLTHILPHPPNATRILFSHARAHLSSSPMRWLACADGLCADSLAHGGGGRDLLTAFVAVRIFSSGPANA